MASRRDLRARCRGCHPPLCHSPIRYLEKARPALHHVKRVISESQFLDTLFHNVGEVLKGVNEILMARHTALAEAGIVGRHHVKGCGKPAGSDSGTCWTKSEIHARADG